MLGTATVRTTAMPNKVSVGLSILDVVRQPDTVELYNSVLDRPVWRFAPDEFARLDKVQP